MINGVRQFKLINARGEEYDMTRPEALFHDPQGLGWGIEVETVATGHAQIVVETVPEQPKPQGEMVFRDYAEYERFLDHIQIGGLVLAYKPLDRWRYLDVVASLDKGEIEYKTRHLVCRLRFEGLGQWYEQLQLFRSVSDESIGKRYDYSYNYTYADAQSGRIAVKNGNLTSYFRLIIIGPAVNPAWMLYQAGERKASGRMLMNLPAGHKLVIDSNPATMEIAEYTIAGDFIADRYDLSDFSTSRLFELPAGECSMALAQDGNGTVNAWLEVRSRV